MTTLFWTVATIIFIILVSFAIDKGSKTDDCARQAPPAPQPRPVDTPRPQTHDNDDHRTETPADAPRVSRRFFDSCKAMAARLADFARSMQADSELLEYIDAKVGGIDCLASDDSIAPGFDNRLIMLLMMDINNCVLQQGHDFNRPERENLCACMLWGQLAIDEFEPDYDNTDFFWHICPGLLSMLQSISTIRSAELGSHEFYLMTVFTAMGSERADTYRSLLLQFSTLVANADGHRDSREAAFLSGFMEKSTPAIQMSHKTHKAHKAHKPTEASNAAGSQTTSAEGDDPVARLNSLIGLSAAKAEVIRLMNFIKIQHLRQQDGLKSTPVTCHCVFTGNPGTGKTTVARILAAIYHHLGVIKTPKLVETDRSGLVAEYVGQTAVKTNKIIDSALDGVLFIDEAYTLTSGGNSDYGMEAIATLLKRMEDDRDRLVVIIAGYNDEINAFVESNPGLKSRFSRFIHFDDYSADELMAIFELNVDNHQYRLTDSARQRLRSMLECQVASRDKYFGNARHVRNLFERTLENQACRLADLPDLSRNDLETLTEADIPDNK